MPQRHCSGIRLFSLSHELFQQVLFATLESCLRGQLEAFLKRVENSGIVVEVLCHLIRALELCLRVLAASLVRALNCCVFCGNFPAADASPLPVADIC